MHAVMNSVENMGNPAFVAAENALPLPAYIDEIPSGGMLFVMFSAKDSKAGKDAFSVFDDRGLKFLPPECPGLLSVARYQATDGKLPDWLDIYVLQSTETLESKQCNNTRERRCNWENGLLQTSTVLDRRLYRCLYTKTAADYETRAKEGHVVKIIGLEPSLQLGNEEIRRWYEEEHVPILSSVPGWLRSTRWELVDAATSNRRHKDECIPRFLAVHEWENGDGLEHPEWKRAVSTEWRNSLMDRQNKAKEERRSWKLYKRG